MTLSRLKASLVAISTLFFFALFFPLAAFAAPSNGDRLYKVDRNRATSLTVTFISTPSIRVAHFHTYGTFLQVADGKLELATVNKALIAAILADERKFVYSDPLYLSDRHTHQKGWGYQYEVQPQHTLISTSTEVVSALLPTTRHFPSGNDGAGWLSVTLRTRSATAVGIDDLFVNPAQGLAALARAARERLLSTSEAVKRALTDPLLGTSFGKSLQPTAENFRDFALTVHGLALGFHQDTVTWPAAGRILVVLPYAAIRRYLSPLGGMLIANTRRPTAFITR